MLISADYEKMNRTLHKEKAYGSSGKKHALTIKNFIIDHGINTALDYGCGKGKLKKYLDDNASVRVAEYDPAIFGKDILPLPAQLVTCTDVLEHIEPDLLSNVLFHLRFLTERYGYFVIATRPAKKVLSDGRNAHLIIQEEGWWMEALRAHGFRIKFHKEVAEEEHLFIVKPDNYKV